MSMLIKGMKMPAAGAYICELGVIDENTATLTIHTPINESQRSYKLVTIPTHGDLIDKTDLMASLADWQLSEAPEEGINWDSGRNVTSHELQYTIYRLLGDVYEEVRDEPVVIPAERSEDAQKAD